MQITFRQIKIKDFEFLWQLHNAALKKYITATWGWNEDWQRRNFEKNFNLREGEIIVVGEKDAGFLWISEKETEIALISIRLLPEFQNRGIGTKLIKDVLDKARAQKKPVRLQVLKINPAQNLYEKLGFEVFGETATHFLMRFPVEEI
ncbi:MAG TPA: GNAT family N-acetyltransferase [Pyrinomonadaceae bacterium]|jgi:ribosomal protein S18 acetylase RimI-like enzyme